MRREHADQSKRASGKAGSNGGKALRAAVYRPGDREDAVRLLTLCGAKKRVGMLPEAGSARYPENKAFVVREDADFPVSVWRTFAQADDLLNEGSFAAFAAEGNEALAFACLHEGENEQESELGWLGARSGCDALMQSVDRKRMEYVLAGGFVQLTAEIDDTDPYQRPLLEK